MAFFFDYIQHRWATAIKDYDQRDLKNFQDFMQTVEKERQRDRILFWRDRTSTDDFAANADEPEYYHRTGAFVWRIKDTTGRHKARNHQYLYNLEIYGHKQYSRRDQRELAAKQNALHSRINSGELGPLSPL